jgi:hypothetical protein
MTKTQAAELRAKTTTSAFPPCEHPNLGLESSDDGYLTGDYHCIDSSETIAKKL